MTPSVLISVIVPIYNTKEYLDRCIQSICSQTYTNLEIILIDDGSTDGSSILCEQWMKRDKRIRVFHKKNGGLSDARNCGIDIATGEYIGFVDSDDYIEPQMYEILLNGCIKYKAKMACCGRFDEFEGKTQKESFIVPTWTWWKSEEAITNLLLWNGLDSAAWDKLYEKKLWDDIKYPYGEISEDVPITGKLIQKAGGIVHVGKPLYHYCHRENSITTSEYTKKSQQIIEHAIELKDWIKNDFPNSMSAYESFYCKELMNTIAIYQISSLKTRKKYRAEYKSNLKTLRKYKYVIKHNPYLKFSSYWVILLRWNTFLGMQYRCRRKWKS